MERTVIKKCEKKCAGCGQRGSGLLIKSLRYDRLPPAFLCLDCVRELCQALTEKGAEE